MKNLEEKIIAVLQMHKNEKLTINEIVLKIFKLYPDFETIYNLQVVDQLSKKSGFAQCCAEIGARYKTKNLKIVKGLVAISGYILILLD